MIIVGTNIKLILPQDNRNATRNQSISIALHGTYIYRCIHLSNLPTLCNCCKYSLSELCPSWLYLFATYQLTLHSSWEIQYDRGQVHIMIEAVAMGIQFRVELFACFSMSQLTVHFPGIYLIDQLVPFQRSIGCFKGQLYFLCLAGQHHV